MLQYLCSHRHIPCSGADAKVVELQPDAATVGGADVVAGGGGLPASAPWREQAGALSLPLVGILHCVPVFKGVYIGSKTISLPQKVIVPLPCDAQIYFFCTLFVYFCPFFV
jgi:hypothetical protein